MEVSCAVNVSVDIFTYICKVEISADYPSISRDQSKALKISQGVKKSQIFRSFQGTAHSSFTEAVIFRTQRRFRFIVFARFPVRE